MTPWLDRRCRRSLACLAAALGVVAAVAGCGGSSEKPAKSLPHQDFVSRPDLKPPVITVTTPPRGTSPGYVFLAPKKELAQSGPLILDSQGRVVWFNPHDPGATDFRVQRYQGRPVLTWWHGIQPGRGYGRGSFTILDPSYRQVREVHAGNGLTGDLHDFLLTPRNTAVFSVYTRLKRDLSSVGGHKRGTLLDSGFQELDLATGRVLFDWRSSDHIRLSDSYLPPKGDQPYDYTHVNSVDVEPNGNYLVSARHTRALYEIDRRSGNIIWQLGGKHSDFRMGPGTTFAWQHDARRQRDGTITVFDNGAMPKVEDHTRVLVLRLDEKRKTATLVRSYSHLDPKLLSGSQGDAQFLPNGHVFVGWGQEPYFSEFSREGRLLFDAHFNKGADSYRAYRFQWVGRPTDRPAIAVRRRDRGHVDVYASWNGATEVARWEVLAGDGAAGALRRIATAPKDGFETKIPIRVVLAFSNGREHVVEVRALDRAGKTLGTSRGVAFPPAG